MNQESGVNSTHEPPPPSTHPHTQHHLPKHQDVKETQINMLGSFFSLSAAIRLSYGSLIAFDHSSQRRSSSGVATGSHMTRLENSIACKFICSFLFLSCSLRPLSMYSARIQQSVTFESIPLLLYPVTPTQHDERYFPRRSGVEVCCCYL